MEVSNGMGLETLQIMRMLANNRPVFDRYYNGLLPALIQGPIARFGDTAANVGILALLSSNP